MINFDKFTKYSKPGPRYTSYPTALEFHDDFNEKAYINQLQNADSSRPISLYFHLPFCRSACYFCGCNVIYTSKLDKMDLYINYLEKELIILSKYLDTSRVVSQLHFGGGTPTFFSPLQLSRVYELIHKTFPNFDKDAEISCEIDPRYFTTEHMRVLKDGGTNRISFGVQDFEPKVQEAVHRVQSFELTSNAVKIARDAGVESINVDLIYGLPYQSFETFKNTLDLTLKLGADRFAVFNYAHVPWMKKTMRKIDETTLPTPAVKLEIFKYTIDFFESHGYKMVGMDHFAKPDDELFKAIDKGELHRNFQGYTTKGGSDLIGVGLTSIGEGERYYAQNVKGLAEYEALVDSGHLPIHRGVELNDDDKLRQYVIMELMSNFSLNIKKVQDRFNIDFFTYFDDAIGDLSEFIDDGLVKIDKDFISVSLTGTLLIRNISLPFDAYSKKHLGKKTFSKTI
jgi:oxygen-independent coproporphyrinogen-3 oxidase